MGARKYPIESVYLDKEGSKSKNAFLQRLRPAKSIKFVILEKRLGQQCYGYFQFCYANSYAVNLLSITDKKRNYMSMFIWKQFPELKVKAIA